MKKFEPLYDRLLVRRRQEEDVTAGGIYIPDNSREKPQEGEVLAVGQGRISEQGQVFPLTLKVGDTILFGKYAGVEVKVNGENVLIIREEEILGRTS